MQIGNSDLMLLGETKIPEEADCHNRLEYYVVCSRVVGTAVGGAQGLVGLVMR